MRYFKLPKSDSLVSEATIAGFRIRTNSDGIRSHKSVWACLTWAMIPDVLLFSHEENEAVMEFWWALQEELAKETGYINLESLAGNISWFYYNPQDPFGGAYKRALSNARGDS